MVADHKIPKAAAQASKERPKNRLSIRDQMTHSCTYLMKQMNWCSCQRLTCLAEIRSWMASNFRLLNSDQNRCNNWAIKPRVLLTALSLTAA